MVTRLTRLYDPRISRRSSCVAPTLIQFIADLTELGNGKTTGRTGIKALIEANIVVDTAAYHYGLTIIFVIKEMSRFMVEDY